MDDRLMTAAYVRLGTSSFEGPNDRGNGVPEKDLALAYAQAVGADVVIYAVHDGSKYDYTQHDVAFYAKQSVRLAAPAPTANDATWPDARILTHPEH